MANRRSSRRTKRGPRRTNKAGLFRKLVLGTAIALIPLGVLGGGGYLAYRQAGKEKITADYCFPRSDQFTAAFFVDFSHTQDTSSSQRRDLINALHRLYDRLPPNGQLAVFTTARAGSATVNRPEFVRCKPPMTNAGMDRIGAPASTKMVLERQAEEARAEFDRLVDDLVARSVKADEQAGYSPILEQIRGISRYDFGAPLSHLSIYTDGIQNSPIARFCAEQGHLPRFEVFAQRPDYKQIAPDNFDGAEIEILLVEAFALPGPGLDFCTHQELRTYWISLFEANGAGPVRLTPLVYGAGQ